jgi:hypothetical protein
LLLRGTAAETPHYAAFAHRRSCSVWPVVVFNSGPLYTAQNKSATSVLVALIVYGNTILFTVALFVFFTATARAGLVTAG